jgi:hypothetical protein
MLPANLVHLVFAKTNCAAVWLLQSNNLGFHRDPWGMIVNMGWPARAVVVALLIMSAWSIGVMIDRGLAFRAARRQSRLFAPAVEMWRWTTRQASWSIIS